MSTERTLGPEQARQVQDALRQVGHYWRRSGVPAPERRDRLEELRLHLEEAAADGRNVTDVVGHDVPAFAAEWIQADRSRPWLDVELRFVTALALMSGALALLGPALFDLDTVGLSAESLTLVGVASAAVLLVDIGRLYRDRLDSRRVTALGVVGVAVAVGLGGRLLSRFEGGRAILNIPIALAVALVGIAVVCSVLSWRLRRTSRT